MTLGGWALVACVALAAAANVPSSPPCKEKQLKLVHVVMRHGVRTPVSTFPNDPHAKFSFPPNGWGQLTMEGIKELHEFGVMLRQRYDKFLGDDYTADKYYSQSTGVDRAIATVMTVNSGLWEPKNSQKWNEDLKWFPIPVFSEPLNDDTLLLVRHDCPQYNIELKSVEQSATVQAELAKYKDLMAYLQEHSGQSMKDFYDIEDIYTTLLAEKRYGLDLPTWTEGYFPDKMAEPAAWSFILKAYNEKLQRLKGGVLLKKLMGDWKAAAGGTITPAGRKAFLYGGHDSTVSNLLSALKVFDPQVPGYGIAILLELSFDEQKNKHGLEIYLRNDTSVPPYPLTLPGCEHFCPLEDVVKLTQNVIPGDWTKECITDDPNYKPEKPGGP